MLARERPRVRLLVNPGLRPNIEWRICDAVLVERKLSIASEVVDAMVLSSFASLRRAAARAEMSITSCKSLVRSLSFASLAAPIWKPVGL